MRVLLTNDDGIGALGLNALVANLKSRCDITVVAPDGDRSGVGHSITFGKPFSVRPARMQDVKAFESSGTPADCVKWALSENTFGGCEPDLVVSGINHGHNCGFHVFYSGTVGAALEGASAGIAAFAVSMASEDAARADEVARLTADLILDRLGPQCIDKRVAYNINIPVLKSLNENEFVWTFQSNIIEIDTIMGTDGDLMYHSPGAGERPAAESGSDRWAVMNGRISVTKLSCNLSVDNGRFDRT